MNAENLPRSRASAQNAGAKGKRIIRRCPPFHGAFFAGRG